VGRAPSPVQAERSSAAAVATAPWHSPIARPTYDARTRPVASASISCGTSRSVTWNSNMGVSVRAPTAPLPNARAQT